VSRKSGNSNFDDLMNVSGLLKLTLQNDNYTDNFPLEGQIMIVYFIIGMNRKIS